MKETVNVHLIGIHAREGERSEKIVTQATGRYKAIPDGCEICYTEQAGKEKEQLSSTVRIYANRLEIMRSGAYGSDMIFEENVIHHTDYTTPYGTMDMVIRTCGLMILQQESEIRINAEYVLELNGQEISQAIISMEVTEQ
ncbi:MAG: DUF1934 domain-containing protein [Butyrivibrio sp.]|nr:DUF1934 domain-containing protein [Butyrivibrio sp.]